jgi:hypothetical protein
MWHCAGTTPLATPGTVLRYVFRFASLIDDDNLTETGVRHSRKQPRPESLLYDPTVDAERSWPTKLTKLDLGGTHFVP